MNGLHLLVISDIVLCRFFLPLSTDPRESPVRVVVLVVMCLVATGCASKEWRQANGVCTASFNQKIPPNYVQRSVQRTRAVTVPNGRVSCYSSGYGYAVTTNCTEGTRTEYVPYTAVITVDLNKPQRDAEINNCTTNSCFQQYGNAKCAVGG